MTASTDPRYRNAGGITTGFTLAVVGLGIWFQKAGDIEALWLGVAVGFGATVLALVGILLVASELAKPCRPVDELPRADVNQPGVRVLRERDRP